MKSTYNNDSLYFLNSILSNMFELLIFKPTRIQFHKDSLQVKSATIIDQIFTNLFTYECTSGNLSYPDSDHHATFAIFNEYRKINDDITDKPQLYRRNMTKIDQAKLITDLNSYDWETLVYCDWETLVYCEYNIDSATENLNNCIQELCDNHAPLTKVSNRRTKYFNKPWIDFDMLNEIQRKNKLYGLKSRIPTASNINKK